MIIDQVRRTTNTNCSQLEFKADQRYCYWLSLTHGDGYSHANGANIDDNDDRDNDEAVDEDDGM